MQQKQLLSHGTNMPPKRLPGFSGKWKVATLEDVARIIVSNIDKKSVPTEQPVRLCNYMDVYRSDCILADMDFMPATATKPQIQKFGLRAGDVLITKDSETPDDIAVPTVIETTAPDLVCGYHLAIIRPKNGADGRFLKFFFEHPQTRRFFASRANGATRFGLTIRTIKTAPITLPDQEEQKRLAELLSTWDRAMKTVEALIANAHAQKHALVHLLLTGKQRLSGFADPWCDQSLGSIFHLKKGQGLSKGVVTADGSRACILYGELYTQYPEVIHGVTSRTNSNEGVSSKPGDVLIPASTTTAGIDLANATAILEGNVLLSGDINILRPKNPKQSAPFFAYLLTHIMRHKIASRTQGITIVHLYGAHLKTLTVHVPAIEEQHAIARIVMDADIEIVALQSQLATIQQEKAALMQLLLAGKRRVRLPESRVA